MKICIVGAGATGGYLGFKLINAGLDVSLVARGAHLEAMKKKGLTIIENEKEIDRFIDVSWGLNETLYSVRIYVEAIDRVGLLKDITSLLSDQRINISGSLTENRDDHSYITLKIFIMILKT